MQNKLKHFILAILFPLWGLGGFGLSAYTQTYPVTISTQLTQPSPIYLSNYANTASINSPIKVQLILNDLTIMNRQVRLKCYFQGAVSFVSNDFVVGAAPIYLEGGFPTQLTNVELGPYFEYQNLLGVNPNQYAQPLPEGIYTLSFEVYDFATNKKLSKKSSVTTIIFQNEPPFLNLPANKAEIVEQNIQNIIFSWTPRSINVSNVEYEFSLVEIWNTNTPLQNAFAYSQPLYTTTTRNTTVQYSIAEPQLIPGKTYAWRVKAKALVGAEEIGVFKNNGYSEIFSFKYLTFCKAPLAITTTDVSQDQAKVTWSGEIDNYDYQVNYREKNADSKWYQIVTPREYITISNLKPKTTYEYTVGAACNPGEYTHSSIQEFTTLAQDEIAFAGCGIKPDPAALSNKTPLPALFPNDVVTAGDFPIVVLKSTGSNGKFSGEGYVTLPFLEKFKELIDAADALGGDKVNIGKYSRIRITFNNIGINTDFKLISGEIVASYDPNWGSMVDGDKLVEDITNLINDYDPTIESIFGPKPLPETAETAEADVDVDVEDETNDSNIIKTTIETTPSTIAESTETSTPDEPEKEEIVIPVANTSNTTTAPSTGSPTENGYYIEYLGKKYYTGGKINIPYARNMIPIFEMKTVAKDTKVDWTIHEVGKQELWRGYTGYNIRVNLPIEDSRVKNNLRIQDLQAEAINIEGNPKVKVLVEKVITPFTQNKLTVTDTKNPKRFATAGKTLYFVNKPIKSDYKEIKLEATLSQTDNNQIPKENIKWKINDIENEYKEGDTEFTIPITDKIENATFTNSAGFPTMIDKTVSVKWVDEDRKDASFMPPAVSATISNFSNSILVPFKKMADGLNEIFGAKLEAKIKPIKIKGENYNDIDEESRHYLKVLKGSINGGVSIKYSDEDEPVFYPPFLKIFNIAGISEVGLYLAPKIEFNIVGGKITNTIGETNKVLKDQFFVEGNVKGCLEVGLKAKLLVAKELVDFSVKGYGEGCMSGKLNYNMSINQFVGGVYLDPVKLAVKAKIKTKDEYFKFTLVDVDKTWTITDKFLIYEYKN
jgi:hypothetical protein